MVGSQVHGFLHVWCLASGLVAEAANDFRLLLCAVGCGTVGVGCAVSTGHVQSIKVYPGLAPVVCFRVAGLWLISCSRHGGWYHGAVHCQKCHIRPTAA